MWIYKKDDVRVPIHSWADDLEGEALAQAKAIASLPFARHVAVMADAHVGFGMPIGGVLATENQILPYGVGGDIGCGMCAFQIKIPAIELAPAHLSHLRKEVMKRVPVGMGARSKKDAAVHKFGGGELFHRIHEGQESANRERVLDPEKISLQIGTLGGGNHFMEFQRDAEGWLWVMLHSGSRNMGQQVVRHYHAKAQAALDKRKENIPRDLAYFPADSEEGQDYLAKMQLALEFAKANRAAMAEVITETIREEIGEVESGEVVNIHHNYAALEEHQGNKWWVHRKGATLATEGTVGIIPGSMGTASYIVEGRGCAESLRSCSHGAGRVLGRNDAKRKLSLEEERKKMKGIIHGLDREGHLDEAPGAYKNIDAVMAAQSELVRPRHRLVPLASMKG
jgi:tRNA-splicing ligase RtcB